MDVGDRKGLCRNKGIGDHGEVRKVRNSSVAGGQGRREVKQW